MFLFFAIAGLLALNLCALFAPNTSLRIQLGEALGIIENSVNGFIYDNYTIIIALVTLLIIFALLLNIKK